MSHHLQAILHTGLLVACSVVLCCAEAPGAAKAPKGPVVFLGSSTTDGFTYPLLVRQALLQAKKPVSPFINAGAGGNGVAQMHARLERDVLAYAPSLVIINSGANDSGTKLPAEKYQAELKAIVTELKARKCAVILSTPNIRGQGSNEPLIEEYARSVRQLAREEKCGLAEVFDLMRTERAKGVNLIEKDNVHPNFAGYRLFARAVLDAMGYPRVQVPMDLVVKPCPGIIPSWQLKMLPNNQLLEVATVEALKPDDTWTSITLPLQTPQESWWPEQARKEGYAVGLPQLLGKAPCYVGVATYTAPKACSVYLNSGGTLQAVWLNGEQVYTETQEYHGYHAGRDRLPVKLRAGANTLVIEFHGEFFVSLTEQLVWEQ